MTSVLRTHVLSAFSCLGDKCEDTCCQGWSMQVDAPMLRHYREQAPELVDAVEAAEESPWIMRKDAATGCCVKLEGGLCGIHKKYGDDFLGDACHFYPRATRKLGDSVLMTAAMSCPEVVRLMLAGDEACAVDAAEVERLPVSLKDYLPPELTAEQAVAIHQTFLAAAEDAATPEQIFLRMGSASRSLERISIKQWPAMAAFYLQHADTRVPPAQLDAADPFNLLHALCGLVVASKKTPPPRLKQTMEDMEKALSVTLDWQNVQIHLSDKSPLALEKMRLRWRQEKTHYAPVLKRWLQMQLSLALFPFSGFGNTLSERITILGVRLATVKLALMCANSLDNSPLPQDLIVRVIQSLSRFLDHLGDPAFSLSIYNETGWTEESRMRGLLES